MAVDTDYLDELMKSIEPTIYPDGVPGEEEETDEYMDELSSIPDKTSVTDAEKEVASAIEAIDAQASQVSEVTDTVDIFDDIQEKPEASEGEIGWEEINVGDSGAIQTEEVELDMNMSEDEIEAMLNAAKSSADDSVSKVNEADDVTDILSMLDGDADLSDIKNTLEKSDNNIALNQSALDMPDVAIPDLDDEEEQQEAPSKKKKAKGKKEKKNSKEKNEGSDKKEKGGFFSKLFNALTEEEEEEVAIPEKDATGITDENAQILSELDSEEGSKKKKKKKKSKGKKGKSDAQGDERDIREKSEDEEGADSKKGKKPKKEKKPKKQKPQDEEKPSKKLPKKRVRNTFILCLSILAALLILTFFATELLTKQEARYAFDNADYETAYADLYGMKLSDDDSAIYEKSRTIMIMQRKVSSYENYMQLGMKAEALNAVLEGYKMYPSVLEKAKQLGVESQVVESYSRLLDALASFGLSEADAEQITSYGTVMYNKKIQSIINNTPFDDGSVSEAVSDEDVSNDSTSSMEDILPEEEDFLPDNPEEVFAQ